MCQRTDNGETRKKIAASTRYGVYLRDNCKCAYCGCTVIPGIHHAQSTQAATLEHIQCWSHDGSDEPTNLITVCASCNFSRRDRAVRSWAVETGRDYEAIRREIRNRKRRVINTEAALEWRRQLKAELDD